MYREIVMTGENGRDDPAEPCDLVELVYFRGCPHVDTARKELRLALAALDATRWREWDQDDAATPNRRRGYPSPTVLVRGRDVMGGTGSAGGVACRTGALPDAARIREAILSES